MGSWWARDGLVMARDGVGLQAGAYAVQVKLIGGSVGLRGQENRNP